MAAHLTINGVEILCTQSEWEPVTLGEVVRSLNGAPRNTGRVKKADYRFTSSLLTLADATATRGLIEGEGHVLSFEDSSTATGWLYTSRELGPNYAPSASRIASGAKWGGAYLRISSSDTAVWQVLPSDATPWTVLMWRRSTTGTGAWEHYICRSDGAVFVGGAINASLSADSFVRRDASFVGSLALRGSAVPSGADFDDVVFLPYAIPSAWAPMLFAFHQGRAWPALPFVQASGARLPAGGRLALGVAGVGTTVPRLGESAEQFPFTLYGA